ncbi:MAG: hypothetical protein AAGI22_19930 [Planctomycetota bacterium]
MNFTRRLPGIRPIPTAADRTASLGLLGSGGWTTLLVLVVALRLFLVYVLGTLRFGGQLGDLWFRPMPIGTSLTHLFDGILVLVALLVALETWTRWQDRPRPRRALAVGAGAAVLVLVALTSALGRFDDVTATDLRQLREHYPDEPAVAAEARAAARDARDRRWAGEYVTEWNGERRSIILVPGRDAVVVLERGGVERNDSTFDRTYGSLVGRRATAVEFDRIVLTEPHRHGAYERAFAVARCGEVRCLAPHPVPDRLRFEDDVDLARHGMYVHVDDVGKPGGVFGTLAGLDR